MSTPLQIHADLTQRAVVNSHDLPWTPSPMHGVARRMLERDGGEVARATTIVRFAADAHFSQHSHGLGEEFLVLDGVFCDEHGDYPHGSYVRNPPGSEHTPYTKGGCTILVKLRQMAPVGEPHVVVDTVNMEWQTGSQQGVTRLPLFRSPINSETVHLERLAPDTEILQHSHPAGEEFFVLEGACADEHGIYPAGTWVRQPAGSTHTLSAPHGCLLWVKRGHLPVHP